MTNTGKLDETSIVRGTRRKSPMSGAVAASALDDAASRSPFFTVAQLALHWQLSARQVHRFVVSGELKPTRFGRAVRISAEEVARFEASRIGVK